MKIGSYLPSAVLISVAMIFGGLRIWVDLAWSEDQTEGSEKRERETQVAIKKTWSRRARPVIRVLAIMIMTHVYGGLLFTVVTSSWFSENRAVRINFHLAGV